MTHSLILLQILIFLTCSYCCLGLISIQRSILSRSYQVLLKSNEKDSIRVETLSDRYLTSESVTPSVEQTANIPYSDSFSPQPLNELQIFTLLGSSLSGLLLGAISDFSITSTIEPWIAPILLAITFAGGIYLLETESELTQPKEVVETIFGKPFLLLKNRIQTIILQTITNTRNAIINKKNEIIYSITSIPSRIKQAIVSWIQGILRNILNRINAVINQALAPVRAIIDGIKRKIQEQVKAIQDNTQRKIDEILLPPRQALKEFQQSFRKVESSPAVASQSPNPRLASDNDDDDASLRKPDIVIPVQTNTEAIKPTSKTIANPAVKLAIPKLPALSFSPVSPTSLRPSFSPKQMIQIPTPKATPPAKTTSFTSPDRSRSESGGPSNVSKTSKKPLSLSFSWQNSFSKGQNSVTKQVTAKTVSSASSSPKLVVEARNTIPTKSSIRNNKSTANTASATIATEKRQLFGFLNPTKATPTASSSTTTTATTTTKSRSPSASNNLPSSSTSASSSSSTTTTSSTQSPLASLNRFFSLGGSDSSSGTSLGTPKTSSATTTSAKAESKKSSSKPVFSLGSTRRK